jgi:predicted nuclease of predicted toxin-antitoxin system
VKLLLDTCVWGGARFALRDSGHDAVWAGEWAEDPGDEAILATALADGRILVTLDKDFGELAVVRGASHAGIVRIVGFAARDQASACALVIGLHREALAAGAIVTVEPGRIRIRPPAGA